MSRYYRSSGSGIGYPQWTPAVKTLIITCVVVFVAQLVDGLTGAPSLTQKFGLTPADVTQRFFIWQLVTYIFLHAGPMHILLNMLGLWMFGSDLERQWGTRAFTRFFFICGVGAGVLSVLVDRHSTVATIGASGAVYGILLAFAMLFPNRIIYWIIFPIPAKWFVLIIGGLAFFSSLSAARDGISHIAHLGGMVFAFAYMKGGSLTSDIKWRYQQWRRARLRRKFDVYYNERQRDDNERWRRWR